MARLSFAAPSSRRRGGMALVAGLGGATLLLCLGRAPSFVAPPGSAQAEGRRAAVASLLVPLAGAAAGSPAYADEVNGVTFTAPDAEKWDVAQKPGYGGKGFLRKGKEYGILFVFPTSHKASIKQIANQYATPTFRGPPGMEILNYKLGEDQDDLEMSVKAISANPETFDSWVTGGQGVTLATRQWYRKVKQNGKEFLLMGICKDTEADKFRDEIERFFDSARVV